MSRRAERERGGWTQRALIVILGVAVLGSTLAIAKRYGDYAFFDPLIEIRSLIDRYYVEEADEAALQRGAIDGMLEALGDAYTAFVSGSETEAFSKELTGEYVGIGAEVVMRDGWLTIVTPLDDSPAFRAGVMADDRVVEIDGESTRGLSIAECIDRLQGKPGTPVTLTVERGNETLEIGVTRDRIRTRSVRGFHREAEEDGRWTYLIDPDRRIAYVRLTQFTPGIAEEVERVLIEHGAGRAGDGALGGLVMDVRWNAGGLLDEATALADLFLDDGVIVSTRGRAHRERVVRASRDGTLTGFPIVVLVNAQSASASEVLAGALVENDRAVVVGTRSFGKGSVQSVRSLESRASGGGVLKLTEQRYYLPSGRSLQRTDDSPAWGVDPSPGFFVPVDDAEMREMLRIRREQEILRTREDNSGSAAAEQWSDPDWILDRLRDRQLSVGVRAIQTRLDDGVWPAPAGDAPEHDEVTLAELRRTEAERERILRALSRVERRIEAMSAALPDEALEAEPRRLWPEGLTLAGGEVIVRGPDGDEIARLRILGDDLGRWLFDAPVAPVTDEEVDASEVEEREPAGAGSP